VTLDPAPSGACALRSVKNMESHKQQLGFRYLTSTVALLAALFSLGVCGQFGAHIQFRAYVDGLPRFLTIYDWIIPPVILIIHTTTLTFIWVNFRYSYVMACIGVIIMIVAPFLIIELLKDHEYR
jgi:hypothetical protein